MRYHRKLLCHLHWQNPDFGWWGVCVWGAFYSIAWQRLSSPQIISCTSWCSLLWKRNDQRIPVSGQVCAHIFPSPQSNLATGPRFIRLEVWLHEEDTWLKGGASLCGTKTAGFSIKVQNPAPQWEKLPIDQDDHRIGEFGSKNPPRRVVHSRTLVSSGHHPHPSHKLHLDTWRWM